MIEIKPISGAIGAEIYGIDLSEPISNENYLQLRNLWVKHQVIFFRDQKKSRGKIIEKSMKNKNFEI